MFIHDFICAVLVSEAAWQDYLARSNVPQKLEADLMDPYCRCLTIFGLSELVNLNIQPVMWIFVDFYIIYATRIFARLSIMDMIQFCSMLSFIHNMLIWSYACLLRWSRAITSGDGSVRLCVTRLLGFIAGDLDRPLHPLAPWWHGNTRHKHVPRLKHDETYELITRENAVSNEDIIQGFLCIRYPRCLGEVCPKCSIEFL